MGRDQRKRITDFVITMVSMALVSLHFSIGLVGLLWPIRRMNKSTFTMLGPVLLLISIKILLMLVFPLGQYAKYEFNLSSMLREILTLTMFYAWFIVGYKIYNYRFFTSLGKAALTAALIFVPFVQLFAVGLPIMHNISADQAVFFFIIFIVFFDKRYNYYFVLFALAILLLTSTHLVSSYTTISCLSLTFIFCIRSTALSRVIVPWRITVIVAIVCLALTSLFASYVNLKDSRVSEGNNGQARETLAQHAFSVFMDFPLIGTPLGRGIVPLEAVEELGWEQYLDPEVAKDMAAAAEENSASLGYDVYSLSFHNGFLYLLTRFGVLSLFLIYFLVRYVPRKGPLPIVIFTVLVLLSISANVVIESLRSGPGVALVLGALFSFGELSSRPKGQDHLRGSRQMLWDAHKIPACSVSIISDPETDALTDKLRQAKS